MQLTGTATGEKINQFLRVHAVRTWSDSGSHTARFTNQLPGSAFEHCRAIISTPTEFVPRSQQLASLLQQSMTTHPRHIEGNEVDLVDVPEFLPDENRRLQKAAVVVGVEDFDFDM